MSIAVVDVAYGSEAYAAAAVCVEQWADDLKAAEVWSKRTMAPPPPYEAGAFYKRELPALLEVLALGPTRKTPIHVVVIDGFVELEGGAPGLGARLYDVLKVPVVSVAKSRYSGATAHSVLRGWSKVPLLVQAKDMGVEHAAGLVRTMHGSSRIPTLLHAADAECRRALGAP